MSRFADPFATDTFEWEGPCQCPDSPHERDTAEFRTQLGASAMARIGRAELEAAVRMDPFASHRQLVLETVTSWNLLWPNPFPKTDQDKGTYKAVVPVPINESTVGEMDEAIVPLAEHIDRVLTGASPPNDSGAPLPESSQGSASNTRTRTRKRTT